LPSNCLKSSKCTASRALLGAWGPMKISQHIRDLPWTAWLSTQWISDGWGKQGTAAELSLTNPRCRGLIRVWVWLCPEKDQVLKTELWENYITHSQASLSHPGHRPNIHTHVHTHTPTPHRHGTSEKHHPEETQGSRSRVGLTIPGLRPDS
jgi:hypothetical protein